MIDVILNVATIAVGGFAWLLIGRAIAKGELR